MAGKSNQEGVLTNIMIICHMSSVHKGLDIRIFRKECLSLVANGYQVNLVINATEEEASEAKSLGINLIPMISPNNRIKRMFVHNLLCFIKAKETKSDIYHFHDPELIPYGVVLKIMGKRVIYDVHEDLALDIQSKHWVPEILKFPLGIFCWFIEAITTYFFFEVIAATKSIETKFKRFNPQALAVCNYPIITDYILCQKSNGFHSNQITYVGMIDIHRGICEIIKALELVDKKIKLDLCGSFTDSNFRNVLTKMSGWSQVNELGFLKKESVNKVLDRAFAGLVIFDSVPNHIDSEPNKLFEYMAAGLPVICSNFPIWEGIINEYKCGICVNPKDSFEIAEAIKYLYSNPFIARKMGECGKKAVENFFNWPTQEKKLLSLYKKLASF